MRYAQIRDRDISNGPGIRTSIFFTGCNHNCKGCFNKEYQDFSFGEIVDKSTIDRFIKYGIQDHISGWSLLGGEPLQQDHKQMMYFMTELKENAIKYNKTIWMWTGDVFENLIKEQIDIVYLCDVLVDGPFIEAEKDLSLQFRGSSNQRIINVRETINKGEIVCWTDEYMEV